MKLKAPEESFKNNEIGRETYEERRDEIVGGDLSTTHLVKGLDFKLLERIRRGEDISLSTTSPKEGKYGHDREVLHGTQAGRDEDDDADFDKIAQKEVNPIQKEKTAKKGHMVPMTLVPGRKRTRNEIIAELKAARAAADAAHKKKESSLGSGFKKIGQPKKPGSRIERDSKGREVLIIVDEDGHERRKVRKVAPDDAEAREMERLAMIPDKNAKPLGMEVPDAFKKTDPQLDEDENDDIFKKAGDDYDPLAGLDEESDSDNKDLENDEEEHDAQIDDHKSIPTPALPQQPSAVRDYFADSKTKLLSEEQTKTPSLSDPSIRAALKKAAILARSGGREDQEDLEMKSRDERRRKMLGGQDRDAEDMDLGFGTSRFEDDDDIEADEKGIRLSKWGGKDDEDEVHGGGRKQKRKRGPKKRKGDKDSVSEVMRVLEGRRAKQ